MIHTQILKNTKKSKDRKLRFTLFKCRHVLILMMELSLLAQDVPSQKENVENIQSNLRRASTNI
jgi:hypothetical protein